MMVRKALRAAAALAVPLWWALGATTGAWAAKDSPDFHVNDFAYNPDSLNYFEDSDVILFHDYVEGLIYRSEDAGSSWQKVTDIPAQEASRLVMHEYDNNRAYVMTERITHYRTEDRGKTWTTFLTDAEMSLFQYDVLVFHAHDPDRIIFNGMDCTNSNCGEVTMYTLDGFRSDARYLRGNTGGCWWACASSLFTTGSTDLDANRILCIIKDRLSLFKQDQRLVISDNFFQATTSDGAIQEFEPNLDTNRPVQGIVNLAAIKKYLLVATTSLNTDEMALFVTDDTLRWHRAIFQGDHHVNQEAYTVLESTNYSLQIDVMTSRPSAPMGMLYTSNSNGTFFSRNVQYTNRNQQGHVDFEKISGIQGIFLVNRVENGEAVDNDRIAKKIVTEITFDDGRTFAPVTVGGKDRLHLHSVTDLSNIGRVYSSPAPGLVMAIGNTGESLGAYADGSLYVSDDAGVTWSTALEGPHKYEFGDQGSVLVAVRDAAEVGEISYSLDHGLTWRTAELPDGLRVRPVVLTTTQDSTSLKFMLMGDTMERAYLIGIDFEGMNEATCKPDDMEDWWARVDDKGAPTCLMGHTQKYHRRKKEAACFLRDEFRDPVVETTDCDCTDMDFECDYNFQRDESGACVKVGPVQAPEGACGREAKADATFKGSSGWRLIPGNTCRRTSGAQKDDLVEYKCADSTEPPAGPASGNVESTVFDLGLQSQYAQYEKHYLERGDSSSEGSETIIMRPLDSSLLRAGPIFVTQDHGKTWVKPEVFEGVTVWAIVPHDYFKEVVFFVTDLGRVIYTVDHGEHYHEFEAPYPPDTQGSRMPLVFHPDKKDWLIWVGEKCEGTGECFTEASYSTDRGDNWRTLLRYVDRCEFIGSSTYQNRKTETVLCLARAHEAGGAISEDNPLQLVSSRDWFQDERTVHEENAKAFATMAEFIVVAAENREKKSLRALASLDGETYAEAQFPANLNVPEQHEYTVLDSSTHAVNLFVAMEMRTDQRYGTIIKSNSNGTSYVLSIAGVNCDNRYYVDFEKVLGLEGVLVVNVVGNRDEEGTVKILQTKISHNDGAEWAYLPPPDKDVDGKAYGCKPKAGASEGGDGSCALHIHGYTERQDHRKAYSSEGAVGLMFGVGNVGDRLGDLGMADTFMTTDAGLSWKAVQKGAWTWQFGDMGSIVVLVPREGQTNSVTYTTDEGATWQQYRFQEAAVEVLDITTLRSGASRNFLLWCRAPESGNLFTVNLDFSGLADRPCEHNDQDAAASDYYLWSPSHPLMPESQCLFGHVSQYLRKKSDRTCYNGYRLQHLYNAQNCTCSRRDYECDYNYELDNHGQCSLVPGLSPLSKEEWCSAHPDEVDYYPVTGFRRIPLTTCAGGDEFDKQSAPEACDNHEDEFERKHRGPSAGVIVLLVLLPVGVAAAVGWYVYRNWTGKFGAIRLGENGTSRFSFDSDTPWVRYPVMAVAGVVAAVSTLPLVVSALWRVATGALERWTGQSWGSGGGARGAWSRLGLGLGGSGTQRFTTRDSFARGRADYSIVDDDEGELLGEESDEEV